MQRITKKEFDCYFRCYASVLEKAVRLAVRSEIEGKNTTKSIAYKELSSLLNEYWHLAQDFRPHKYFSKWLRDDLSCIDDIFENLEYKYKSQEKDQEFQKVKSLHGKTILKYITSTVGPNLEELRKGSSDYIFYKKMKEKGERILNETKGERLEDKFAGYGKQDENGIVTPDIDNLLKNLFDSPTGRCSPAIYTRTFLNYLGKLPNSVSED